LETPETVDQPAAEETPAPEINVADKTWETAEETHPTTLETDAEGRRKPEVAGADNKVEVKSEIEAQMNSEDVREVIESDKATNAAGEVDQEQTEETNEATAS
jgi:hypothetical protein